jgi:hypothetical protein
LTGDTSSSRKQSFTRTTGRKARVASENNRKLYPSTVPAYDFLRKEDGEKSIGSLLPRAEWWYGVVAISLTCMLASIITLWAPYPLGARTPTETVAMMSFSNGCVGLNSCTCPRETICADDSLSMIFLTIARATAFFNYPLYMLLFLSKANNLNNFLQKTVLKCWINFSDFHRVHTLFGMIVGLESTSHSFFHVLRWARRKNDIQVRLLPAKLLINSNISLTSDPCFSSTAYLDEHYRHHGNGRHRSNSIYHLTHGGTESQTTNFL